MCENHRNIPVREIERPIQPLDSMVLDTRGVIRTHVVQLEYKSPLEPEVFEGPFADWPNSNRRVEASVLPPAPAKTPVKPSAPVKASAPQAAPKPVPQKPVVQAKAPEPAPEPVVAKPVERSKRTGTLPNPNKVRKAERVVTSGNTNSSTTNADGTVNADALLKYIHSVPARGLGKRRRRR